MSTIYKHILKDGSKVQVDSAVRDGAGRKIHTNYVRLDELDDITSTDVILNDFDPLLFEYTGSIQTVTLIAGDYKIECWGAKGGTGNSSGSQSGGVGGYTWGELLINTDTTLYLVVGGLGESSTGVPADTLLGGYNGGGNGGHGSFGSGNGGGGGGGGGASHVATSTGLLSSLSSNTSAIKLVAGGGGGGCWNSGDTSPCGGGTEGASSHSSNAYCGGAGTQSAGGAGGSNNSSYAGSFGQGGAGADTGSNNGAGGGGGGYYGGGGGMNAPSGTNAAGGGGSGFVGSGIIAQGATLRSGQTGFIDNPDTSGNGCIRITLFS